MPFRDTFWNIPHWAEILLYVVQGLGVSILTGRLYLRFELWRRGRGPLQIDHFWQRVGRVARYAFAQVRIAREKYAGIMHLSIFLAFLFLFMGTALATIDYDIGVLIFDVKLLQGGVYLIYELVLDFFTVAGIMGLALALLRRVTPRPAELTYNAGFAIMLWLLLISLLSGLLLESFRLAATQPAWQIWSFAGFAVSRVWLAAGMGETALRAAHLATWVFHFTIAGLIYAVSLDLPLKHIIYSPINVFFSSFRPAGALAPLDLEDETIESFGAGAMTDFTPMQIMDGDACTECGRCQAACPAFMAGTPLNPKQVVIDIREALNRYEPDLRAKPAGGYPPGSMPVLRTFVSDEAIWACTTCRACVYECPVLIEHVDSIVDMRRYLTLMDGDIPDLLATAMTQAERAGDPWGNQRGTRLDWAKGLNVPVMSEKRHADVLYWVGCAGAYDLESQKTTQAMVRIFEAAGINYAVLGDEERCNCEWARRAGNEYLYQEAAHSNIAVFDQYEFNLIVTHCPHCFNTFKNEYPQFGGQYDVTHHSSYIRQLIQGGHLQLRKPVTGLATYHDSCYLGRYNNVYADPRTVLDAIDGLKLVEMERSRQKGLCCGGGGAQVWFETHQEKPVNSIRLEEAMGTGAETVAAACPFCAIMLNSAAQSAGTAGQIITKDLALLVAEAL
jgi:Fe-S oxidoreductase